MNAMNADTAPRELTADACQQVAGGMVPLLIIGAMLLLSGCRCAHTTASTGAVPANPDR